MTVSMLDEILSVAYHGVVDVGIVLCSRPLSQQHGNIILVLGIARSVLEHRTEPRLRYGEKKAPQKSHDSEAAKISRSSQRKHFDKCKYR